MGFLSFKRTRVGISVIAIALVAGACSSSKGATGGAAGCDKTYTVAMLHGLANQFQSDIGKGAASLASRNCITFQQLYFNLNSQRENAYVADLITKQVDL